MRTNRFVPSRFGVYSTGMTSRVKITLEQALYALLLALALVSRLWDLGAQGMGHDESLIAQFSGTSGWTAITRATAS